MCTWQTLKPGGPRFANVRRLTFDDRNDMPFDWTPDSKAIIFQSDRNGTWEIFKQGIDQRAPEAVVTGPTQPPSVSADGAWIIYAASKDKPSKGCDGDVWFFRVPIKGGPAEPIMRAGGNNSIVQCRLSSACVLSERSTDGKQLLFYAFDPLLGKGRELSRMNAAVASDYNWTMPRDGSSVAVVIPGEGDGRIRILPLSGGYARDVIVKGWSNLQFIDAASGTGWYSSSSSAASITLLYIDLQGHAQALSENIGCAVPSPDGRHLALLEWNTTSNAWMIENF
jgi:hypothetical protein